MYDPLKIKFFEKFLEFSMKTLLFRSAFEAYFQVKLYSFEHIFLFFRRSFESLHLKSKNSILKIHWKLAIYAWVAQRYQQCLKCALAQMWRKMFELRKSWWGGFAPSQTLPNFTHMPSTLWMHISGIVDTFVQLKRKLPILSELSGWNSLIWGVSSQYSF